MVMVVGAITDMGYYAYCSGSNRHCIHLPDDQGEALNQIVTLTDNRNEH